MFVFGKQRVFFLTFGVPVCAQIAFALKATAIGKQRQAVGVGAAHLVKVACAQCEFAGVADVFFKNAVQHIVAAVRAFLEGFVTRNRANKTSAQAVFW